MCFPNRFTAVSSVTDEPYTICIKVKPNRELSQQIFSFIPDVEVLAPEWFRNEIKEKIQNNLSLYLGEGDIVEMTYSGLRDNLYKLSY